MIKNLEITNELMENYSMVKDGKDYSVLCKKFKTRFPVSYEKQLLESYNNPYISLFVYVMKAKNKENYLENFYSNLSNSRLIKNKLLQNFILEKEVFGGSFFTKRNNYLILGNKKELEKNNAELTPYHELLHLLTTKVDDKDTIRIGLQYNDFAIGINEGYTEVLTKRYFGHLVKNDFNAYIHFTWFIDMLEDIVGKTTLEKLYFNNDLEGLIEELEYFIPREKVYTFLEDIDKLFNSEDELFSLEKSFLHYGNNLDNESISEYYEVDKELLNRIYENFLQINDNKEKKYGIKTDFKEKNDIIKEKYDREEDLYKEYFKEEYKKHIK